MISGACHCGKVQYEADSAISDLSHCHCSTCRKLHGAAFATFARIALDKFRWPAGEDDVKTYPYSESSDKLFVEMVARNSWSITNPNPMFCI